MSTLCHQPPMSQGKWTEKQCNVYVRSEDIKD